VQNHPNFNPKRIGIGIDSRTSHSYGRNLYLYHFLVQHFRRWRLRFHAFDYVRAERAGVAPDLLEDAKKLRINPWLVNLGVEEKNNLLDNLLLETEDNMRAWDKIRQLLSEIHELSTDLRSRLMIVIFPASIQVNDSHFEFYKKLTFNLDQRTLSSSRAQNLLLQFCAERSIPCLDMLPVFRARKQREFYREKDDHLNESGSQLARELILDFLRRHAAWAAASGS
jgi:hypothetical protein